MTCDEAGTPADGKHFWVRVEIGWHLLFAGFVATAIVSAIAAGGNVGRTIATVGLLLVWVGWYFTVGVRAWRDGAEEWTGILYGVGMVALVLTILGLMPELNFLLFVASPQIFAFVDRLRYALPLLAITCGGFAIELWAYGYFDRATSLYLAGSIVFGGLIGAFISGIVRQSSDRAALIKELRSTRNELETVSHERGALAERQRLSLEIHDTIAQGFTSIVMLLEAAEADVARDPDNAKRMMGLARRTARENLSEARSLVATLSGAGIAEGALPDVIRRLVDRFAEEMGLSASMVLLGEPRPLGAAEEVVLLRACQESLANVRKHAAARSVEVSLEFRPSGVALTVADDGRGFDVEFADGFGLHGMHDRVTQIGGTLNVVTAPGAGTKVEVAIP